MGASKKDKFSLSLEAIPTSWAKLQESDAIINTLGVSLQPELKPSPFEKFEDIQSIIAADYIRFFAPDFDFEDFKSAVFASSNQKIGVQFNNRAVLCSLSNKSEEALGLLVKTSQLDRGNIEAFVNLSLLRWTNAELTDEQLIT